MASRARVDRKAATAIVEGVLAGASVETAAAAAGVADDVVGHWIETNKKFAAEIRTAKAKAEIRNIKVINASIVADWRAAAWLLARINPARFGTAEQRNTSQATPDPIPPAERPVSVDELRARRAQRIADA